MNIYYTRYQEQHRRHLRKTVSEIFQGIGMICITAAGVIAENENLTPFAVLAAAAVVFLTAAYFIGGRR